MSRLIDIDELKGCAIIRPTTHEEIEHIRACKNLISHDDIPTAMERSTAYYNDGWIPCSSGKMPENEEGVWVVLSHTYEDEYIEYSVARYLRFDNNECHWCEVKYGYLEWDKYSNGTAGSSFYKVIAWKQITPYQPKGEKEWNLP